MRIIHIIRIALTALAAMVGAVVAIGAEALADMPNLVTSDVYENLAAVGGTNIPVTFSRVGGDGDFTQGITAVVEGVMVPAQVDVLRRAPDNSIRHALVSLTVPSVAASGAVRIDWLNAPSPSPPPFQWGFDPAAFTPRLVLTTESGKELFSNAGAILGGAWAGSERVRVVYDGPVMKELEIHDVPVDAQGQPDQELSVYWRLRAFTGSDSVRVEAIVERARARVQGVQIPVQYKFQSVSLLLNDQTLYQAGPYDHLDQTRYRILVWSNGAVEDIHRRPNYDYLVKSRFFPQYRWTKSMTPAQVDQTYTTPSNDRPALTRPQGILENGMIHKHMPNTGGRWEMNPYPSWIPAYLMSGATGLYKAILHADGNGAGAFYIHVRQNDWPGYNVFTVPIPPLSDPYRIPLYTLPDGSPNPVQPDHAHTPSLGYLSYLLTGDRYYAEELSFWASYQLGEWPHQGLNWQGLDRIFAFSMRQVVDAAFILPESDPLQACFTQGVNKCMDEMTAQLVQSGRRVHSPPGGVWKGSGRPYWVNARMCSTWQYSWVVWSLGNTADKGFDKAKPVRDWTAEYIVGFYVSQDEFLAPDGKIYRFDPKDAMTYSMASRLLETEVYTSQNGPDVRILKELNNFENYGEIWYYTKLNEDNAWYWTTGGAPSPPWQLRQNGWGHGFNWDINSQKQTTQYNWHRYGAWSALVTALEAGVAGADQAWQTMLPMAGTKGEYDMEMVARPPEVVAQVSGWQMWD